MSHPYDANPRPLLASAAVRPGLTKSNLPIGLQLLAPAFAEENLLRTARVFERATDWHTRRPVTA